LTDFAKAEKPGSLATVAASDKDLGSNEFRATPPIAIALI
jgi:hypothetical protein